MDGLTKHRAFTQETTVSFNHDFNFVFIVVIMTEEVPLQKSLP